MPGSTMLNSATTAWKTSNKKLCNLETWIMKRFRETEIKLFLSHVKIVKVSLTQILKTIIKHTGELMTVEEEEKKLTFNQVYQVRIL